MAGRAWFETGNVRLASNGREVAEDPIECAEVEPPEELPFLMQLAMACFLGFLMFLGLAVFMILP